jgi:hypothetical protein
MADGVELAHRQVNRTTTAVLETVGDIAHMRK